ncbi:MAG: Flagellar basal-body rod protein FlgC, partial [uncultured Solirubrobacteraceae bacterium]
GPLRRDQHLRQRPLGRAPADGRHRREPRQRAVHARRRRPAVPPQGGHPQAGRRELRERAAPRERQRLELADAGRPRRRGLGDRRGHRPEPSGLRPRPSRRQPAGLRRDAERRLGHRDGRPHLLLARLRGERHRDADREVHVHPHPRPPQV